MGREVNSHLDYYNTPSENTQGKICLSLLKNISGQIREVHACVS